MNSICKSQNLDSLYNLIENNVNEKNYPEALVNTCKYKEIVLVKKIDNESQILKIEDAFAEIYKHLKAYDSAEFYYKNIIKRRFDINGENSYEYANSNFKLGMFYVEIDSFKKAENYLVQPRIILKKTFGEGSKKYDRYLNLVLDYYIKIKEYKKGIPYFDELLEHMRSNLGEDNIDYINSINNLASLYFIIGNYDKSLDIYNKILSLKKTRDIPDLYKNTIYKIGATEFNKKNYINSKNKFKNILDLYNIENKIHDEIYFNTLGYMGLINLYEGESELAINQSTEVYNYFIKDSLNSLNLLQSISNLALIYSNISNNINALKFFNEGIRLIEDSNIQNRESAMLYNNYSLFYEKNIDDLESAIKYGEISLKIRQNIFDNTHTDYMLSMNNQGMLYLKNLEYAKSELYLLKALEICSKSSNIDSVLYSTILSNLSLYYTSTGDYIKSLDYSLQSLKYIFNKNIYNRELVTTSLNNVALSYFYMLDYKNAEKYFKETLFNISLKSKGDSIIYSTVSSNLGMLYERIKNFDKAFFYTNTALNIRREVIVENSIDYAMSLNNLGLVYLDLESLDSAEKYLVSALQIYINKGGLAHDQIETIYSNLAGLFFKKGDYKNTLYYLHESNKLHNDDKITSFLYLSEEEKLKLNQSKKYFYDAYLSFFKEIYPYIPNESQEVYNNILINKEQLLRSYQSFYKKIYNSNDNYLISDFENILNKKELLYKANAKNISNKKINEIKDDINKLENKLNSNKIIKGILLGEKSINWKDIQKKLNINEAAIEFVSYQLYNSKWTDSIFYGALIIKPGIENPSYINLFEENELNEILENNNSLNISHQNNIYNFHGKGRKLYEMIWMRLDSSLKKVNTIFVSLADKLYNINLSAIPINDSLRLGQKYKIHQVISTADIVTFKEESLSKETRYNAWIYGGVNYDSANLKTLQVKEYFTKYNNNRSSEGTRWSYLNSTLSEANTINAILNSHNFKTMVITGSDASENSFKAISNDTSNYILHVATHGFFYPDSFKKSDEVKVVKSNKVFLGIVTEKNELGIKILNIAAKSPAENNKLKINDIIYQIDAIDLKEPVDLYNFLNKKKPNEIINIKYLRDKGKFQTNISLGFNPNKDSVTYKQYEPSAFTKRSDNPLFRSGLIFAGANNINNIDSRDDGILTAYEVSNLNFSGAKLVVLSACETGLGDIVASEGVYGLQRAFKIAGAKNIIMSLWKVPDNQTKELMSIFYTNILKGNTISNALQDAQIEMSKKYSPYYWAAFKLLE